MIVAGLLTLGLPCFWLFWILIWIILCLYLFPICLCFINLSNNFFKRIRCFYLFWIDFINIVGGRFVILLDRYFIGKHCLRIWFGAYIMINIWILINNNVLLLLIAANTLLFFFINLIYLFNLLLIRFRFRFLHEILFLSFASGGSFDYFIKFARSSALANDKILSNWIFFHLHTLHKPSLYNPFDLSFVFSWSYFCIRFIKLTCIVHWPGIIDLLIYGGCLLLTVVIFYIILFLFFIWIHYFILFFVFITFALARFRPVLSLLGIQYFLEIFIL